MSFSELNLKAGLPHALVAEDSLIHQRLARSILAQRGFLVTVVNNGHEAVVATRGVNFDLILMDIEMPVLDGCAAARQIRFQQAANQPRVPIVAVTSLDDRQRVLAAGMDAHLAKPLAADRLDRVLEELVCDSACTQQRGKDVRTSAGMQCVGGR